MYIYSYIYLVYEVAHPVGSLDACDIPINQPKAKCTFAKVLVNVPCTRATQEYYIYILYVYTCIYSLKSATALLLRRLCTLGSDRVRDREQ